MLIGPSTKAVLFDAVGTLIYAQPAVSAVYAAAAEDFGLSLDEATVGKRFAAALDRDDHLKPRLPTTDEAQERDRWWRIVSHVFPEVMPHNALFERLWNHFAQPPSWRVYGDVAHCWQQLIGANLQVGIASNFDERLLAIAAGLPPLDRCQHVFVCARIGWRKPSREFFAAIESALALKPTQLLFIGDDWDSDFLGAQAAGWQALYLDRTKRTQGPLTTHSLAEIA